MSEIGTKMHESLEEYLRTRNNNDGDHERFSHYVRKDQLELALLEGIPCTALCGKKWLPQKDPKRFPVCPDCKRIWEEKEDV